MRVLLTEDDATMARLVRQALEEDGHEVEHVTLGERAVDAVRGRAFELVILDVMLPRLDGFAVCRRLRERGATMPILMLTARDDVEDRVTGLDAGADDYLGKPFSLDELLARVRALGRRGPSEHGTRVAVGDLVVDLAARTAERAGTPVELTPRELAIVALLMREPGRVVSRDRILRYAWPESPEHNSNVIEVLVKRIRDKLDRPFGTDSIETVRGVGYRFRGT